MSNKTIALIVSLFLIIGVGGIWLSQSIDQTPQAERSVSESVAFHNEYPEVSEDNRFVYTTGDEAIEVLESGTGVVFLGFKECPWCQGLAPRVDEAAKAEGLEKIYYLDIRQARTDNDETYQQLISILAPHLEKGEDGQPRIYVPDVSVVQGGEIIERFELESAEGERVTADNYWTEERSLRAVERLREMMRPIL